VRLLILLFSLLSFTLYAADVDDLTQKAQRQNSDSQYQLALLYEQGFGVDKSPEQAFFWLSQAAENGSEPAQMSLANYYVNGIGTPKDLNEAILWYTTLASNGNTEAQVKLGKLFTTLEKPIDPHSLALAWLHAAADRSEEASERYNQLLEARFNQQRAKQISSIEQLDDAFNAQHNDSLPASQPATITMALQSDYLLWAIVIIGLLFVIGTIKSARKKHQIKHKHQAESETLHARLTNQQKIIEQQQRQLKTAVAQIKKLQQNSTVTPQVTNVTRPNQNLELACALFGFQPDTLPNESQLKARYKQLCKIYHPDLKGTQEEMKRLNYSLKVILQRIKNPPTH
jgi:uncharacterized protein